MGGAGMLFLLVLAGKGLWRIGDELLAGRWIAAGAVLVGYALGAAFLWLFANGLTHQRLSVERGVLDYAWRLGPLPLRHRWAPVEDVREVACAVVTRQESSDVYFLEITGPGWRACFGSETSDITLREVLAKFRKLGVRTNPGHAPSRSDKT